MEVSSATASQSRDEFLQLLVTQLRHQDPLSPIQQEDFLAQLAQFSTLESVEQLNENFASQLAIQTNILKLQHFSQAAELVGRHIEFDTFGGATSSGRVDAVSVRDNGVQVTVGDRTFSIDLITAFVRTPESAESEFDTPTLNEDQSVPPNLELFDEKAAEFDIKTPVIRRPDA